MYRLFLPLAFGLALLAHSAVAQDKPKTQSEIVINGKLDDQVDALVRRLAQGKNDRQIARWDDRICARVLGLGSERADYLTGRIVAAAKAVGVTTAGSAKCTPNVLVVFTPFADAFAADVVKNHPDYIQNPDMFGLPHGKLKASYLAPRPVRWFSIRKTVMADGGTVDTFPKGSGDGQHLSFAPPSRIGLPTRENTMLSLIVVDEPKMAGLKWSQLGDYLAMVSLGQPGMDVDYAGEDSVLAVFADRDAGKAAPLGLTEQDRNYLVALYKSDAALAPDQQRGQIKRYFKKQPGAEGN
ncbi:hypothetical protein [Sphingomonas sp.]|uniref:hypothetical protein n=1 Tax=Sphingomonas sp. TaxID=28214 RepID=UPI002E30FFA9|nr:hypothetical protein [Sphingomonas sp.]HEX4695762.1 hypothetical protein [Sphingomonas sp.]